MATYCILGRHGFIGSALSKKLTSLGHKVVSNPTPMCDVVVHLAMPTHLEFEKNLPYQMNEAVQSFLTLLPFCKQNDIYFVYASSALLYENEKKTPFKNCKLVQEILADAYGGETLGLRIFPVYGIGETHTAISQACLKMKRGEAPTVYGDGTQTRDFIYIDDVVDAMVDMINAHQTGIRDIGSGIPTSFNQIIAEINKFLGKDITPRYVKAPAGYSRGITCWNPVTTRVSINAGIRKIILEQ